jgi:hypothetical protein
MTTFRFILVALLAANASLANAAPAPLPKPNRVADNPVAVEHLKKALAGTGVEVKSVEREGRVWLVTFYDFRGLTCGNVSRKQLLRSRGFVAPTRSAALAALLQEALVQYERDMAKLRAQGVIP